MTKYTVRGLAALGAVLALGWAMAQQTQPAAVQMQRAVYMQNAAGDLDAAIRSYREIIGSNPSQRAIAAQAQYRLAQALLQKGDLTGAAQEFQILSANYSDYKDLIKSMASAIPAAVIESTLNSPIGTFRNGRYHHDKTGIEFNPPSGWNMTYSGQSSADGELVEFTDPRSDLAVKVWMKPDGTSTRYITEFLAADLGRKNEDRDSTWTVRVGSSRPGVVGGQQALSATADFIAASGQERHPAVEILTWVRSNSGRAQFAGTARASELPILQNVLDQMMASALVP